MKGEGKARGGREGKNPIEILSILSIEAALITNASSKRSGGPLLHNQKAERSKEGRDMERKNREVSMHLVHLPLNPFQSADQSLCRCYVEQVPFHSLNVAHI